METFVYPWIYLVDLITTKAFQPAVFMKHHKICLFMHYKFNIRGNVKYHLSRDTQTTLENMKGTKEKYVTK